MGYLDFADFDGGDSGDDVERGEAEWTGKQNLGLYFAPAAMAVLFCEVPVAAREAGAQGREEAKKRRQEDPVLHKPSPNYHVGRTDHLQPYWISAAELRAAVESEDRAPLLRSNGKEARVFPT